jgi:hypothetical protein
MKKLKFKDHRTGLTIERTLAYYTTLTQLHATVKPDRNELVGVKYRTRSGDLAWVAASEILNFDDLPKKI